MYKTYVDSEIGLLEICASDKGITAVNFMVEEEVGLRDAHPLLNTCVEELAEYFRGERHVFSVALDLHGTTFQKQVWRELLKIPFGETISYLELAKRVGNEKAMRAVGMANGRNPIALIVPCHRVIGSDGQLRGYASGVWRKEWLLQHESRENTAQSN
jgi:methylated-DNA-[protein]-cysteine S-methyltransferase